MCFLHCFQSSVHSFFHPILRRSSLQIFKASYNLRRANGRLSFYKEVFFTLSLVILFLTFAQGQRSLLDSLFCACSLYGLLVCIVYYLVVKSSGRPIES
jgi:lipid-A-disaccharide synthase-like uncharacterized protein